MAELIIAKKICKKCGNEICGSVCKPCKKITDAASYEKNKAKRKEAAKLWRKNNSAQVKKRAADNYIKNKEHRNAKSKEYYFSHIDRAKETNRAWQIKNADRVKEYNSCRVKILSSDLTVDQKNRKKDRRQELSKIKKAQRIADGFVAKVPQTADERRIKNLERGRARSEKRRVDEGRAAHVLLTDAELKANKANRYIKNKKEIQAKIKLNYAKNRDRFLSYALNYRLENQKRIIEYRASYSVNSKAIIADAGKKYRSLHTDDRRINEQNREAKKRENGGKLSRGLAERLFKLQHGKCACCGKPLGDNYHLDHIMPIALGGPNVDSNIQLLRQRCNNQKCAKHPVDFMQSRGFLI